MNLFNSEATVDHRGFFVASLGKVLGKIDLISCILFNIQLV